MEIGRNVRASRRHQLGPAGRRPGHCQPAGARSTARTSPATSRGAARRSLGVQNDRRVGRVAVCVGAPDADLSVGPDQEGAVVEDLPRPGDAAERRPRAETSTTASSVATTNRPASVHPLSAHRYGAAPPVKPFTSASVIVCSVPPVAGVEDDDLVAVLGPGASPPGCGRRERRRAGHCPARSSRHQRCSPVSASTALQHRPETRRGRPCRRPGWPRG